MRDIQGICDKHAIIHFIGIGGIGMGSLAEMLLKHGCTVRGSDISPNQVTDQLQALGAEVFFNHAATYVRDADVVVYSSAIKDDNVELQQARFLQKKVIHRAELLAALMEKRKGIAIAGTHGKTTSSSMLVTVLNKAGLQPSYTIGGFSQGEQAFSYFGESEYFVAESDESDASFLHLKPSYAIITNIDRDHMQTYNNDFSILKNKFLDFINDIPKNGCVALCIDDPAIASLLPRIKVPYITFGFDQRAMVRCFDFKQQSLQSYWKVALENTNIKQSPLFSMTIPGQHNVLNAMGVLALALHLHVDMAIIQSALQHFQGMARRFHVQGDMACCQGGNALVIDDYGHHPREIEVTMQALRAAWPKRRIILAFQPHRYSRTQQLFDDFVKVLQEPDVVVLTDIYPAGEAAPEDDLSLKLYHACKQQRSDATMTRYCHDVFHLPEFLYDIIQADDIVMLQGAGNIGRIPQQLLHFKSVSMSK